MITTGTHVSGFDARSWHRLVTLVAPGLASRAPHEVEQRAGEEGGTLFVLYHGTRVLRALHTHRGVVALREWPGREGLGELAHAHGARFAIAAEAGALEELYERLGGRVHEADGMFRTVLLVLTACRELVDEGVLHAWPDLVPANVPFPAPAVLERTFDLLLPDGRAALLVLSDGDTVDTAVLVRRSGNALDRVYGPEAIARIVGPLGGDFRRDAKYVRQRIEAEFAPLAFGFFAETATVHAILRSHRAGAWAEALASRDVVMEPLPAWMAVAAGAGAVRAVASRSRGVMAWLGALSPTVQRIREMADAVTGFDPVDVLGFDPWRVLSLVLQRSSPSGSRPTDERTP